MFLLLIYLLIPVFVFPQEKIIIPRYSIVYIFTNQSINEVFFDHQKRSYSTNILSTTNPSIQDNTNTTSIILSIQPNYTQSFRCPSTSSPKGWDRPSGNYRFHTLKNTYLSNNLVPFTAKRKTVLSGLWYDHFTDYYTTNTKDLQIDHIVPFKEAFLSQKTPWSKEKIKTFYNSPLRSALLPVYSSENQNKGSSKKYRPPNPKFQPIYQDMWNHTKKYYDLKE